MMERGKKEKETAEDKREESETAGDGERDSRR